MEFYSCPGFDPTKTESFGYSKRRFQYWGLCSYWRCFELALETSSWNFYSSISFYWRRGSCSPYQGSAELFGCSAGPLNTGCSLLYPYCLFTRLGTQSSLRIWSSRCSLFWLETWILFASFLSFVLSSCLPSRLSPHSTDSSEISFQCSVLKFECVAKPDSVSGTGWE